MDNMDEGDSMRFVFKINFEGYLILQKPSSEM